MTFLSKQLLLLLVLLLLLLVFSAQFNDPGLKGLRNMLKVTLESEPQTSLHPDGLQLQQGNTEVSQGQQRDLAPQWVLDLPPSGGTYPETELPHPAPRVLVRVETHRSMMTAIIQAEV